MDLPPLVGIIPPLPTPLRPGPGEWFDLAAYERMADHLIRAGVHGLWVLGTTARFDLLTDDHAREVAEAAISVAAGRLPLVLNVSDMGTTRTLARAARFDDYPFDYYAALPPWYQPMSTGEIVDYFHALADRLARPLVIYNAPWINNQIGLETLRDLAAHPRVVGVKDVTSALTRTLDWPAAERRAAGFRYLQGTDLIAPATELGADGFVSALANAVPELAVATFEAARSGDAARAFRLQAQFSRIARAVTIVPGLAGLEALCRHRGLLQRMLPAPLRSAGEAESARVIAAAESAGLLPSPV